MDEDEDDFYGGGDQNGQQDHEMSGQDPVKAENQDMSEEEEDSDDDVQFTLEKPETVKTEAAQPTRAASKAIPVEPSTNKTPKTAQTATTVKKESAEPQNLKNELLHNGKEGKDFPEHRTSDINLDEDPTWPADNKKITELDIDADLAEHSKPWRLPGTDVTDFFNYGFDEYTWTQYCARQNSMAGTIGELKDQDTQMKSMLGGMPNMEGGMPDMNAMMQMMMGGGGGMAPDPSKMDFGQMMSMMGGMPPAGGGGFNAQAGFPGQAGGNSPLPQAGQGFQAPHGPSGMQNQMVDGYSAQQMQMMQEQQQGSHGGQGGGRGRGRRGRGYY